MMTVCVINFITHEMVYSLYPRATLEERRSLIFLFRSAARDKAYAKYAERGWIIIIGDDLNSSLACGPRYIADSKT